MSDDDAVARLRSEAPVWFADLRDRICAALEALEAEADALAARIRKGCLEMPDPDVGSIFEHVYVEQTPHLAAQAEQTATYLAGFADGGAH